MDLYCYAVTAPGLNGLATRELAALGLLPPGWPAISTDLPQPAADPGGVSLRGDLTALYRANLHLRTVSRVLVRMGNFFYAKTFTELREKSARLPWERFLRPGQPIELRVTCHKSKLYHSDAVAERIATAIADRLGKPCQVRKPAERDQEQPAQLILARLENDQVLISIDSSGENLHKRGYRLAAAKAPLRETLAAALLLLSGWDTISPLLDPFCGSGTIPIEAALLATQQAPGLHRRFAFMDWPEFDFALWQSLLDAAKTAQKPAAPLLLASDRDAGAIRMAHENAARAGVEQYIQFSTQAVSAIQPPLQPGWVLTNPPYGVRVSPSNDLRNLYAQLGHVLRATCPGWKVGILCNDLVLLGQTRLGLDTSQKLINGGLSVYLGQGQVKG
jgi:putative N6-adenine-specific DNA methylase